MDFGTAPFSKRRERALLITGMLVTGFGEKRVEKKCLCYGTLKRQDYRVKRCA